MNKMKKKGKKQEGLVFGVLRVVSGGGGQQSIVPCIGTSEDQVTKRVLGKWAGNARIAGKTWLSEEEFRKVLPESRALERCINTVEMGREAMTLPCLRPEEFDRS